jgi:hypothetical protein
VATGCTQHTEGLSIEFSKLNTPVPSKEFTVWWTVFRVVRMTKEQTLDELDGVGGRCRSSSQYYWIGGFLVCWLVEWFIMITDLGRGLSECRFELCLLKLWSCVFVLFLSEGRSFRNCKCSDGDILWHDLHTIMQSPSMHNNFWLQNIGLHIILSTFMWQMCAWRGASPGWWWREFWPGTCCSRLWEQAWQFQLSRQWEAGSQR